MATVWVRASRAPAAVISSRSTKRGIRAPRTGRWMALRPAASPARTKIGQVWGWSRLALTSSPTEQASTPGVGQEHEAPAVGRVCQGAAEKGEGEESHHLDDAEQPHRQRRARLAVDLIGDRHVSDHRAEERHRLPGEEESVVAVAAERREVGGEGPPARDPVGLGAGGGLRRGGGEALVGLGHEGRLSSVGFRRRLNSEEGSIRRRSNVPASPWRGG